MSLTDHMHPDELVSSAGALWRDGHVLMRGVLDGDSVSSLRPEFVQAVEQHRAEWPTKVLQAKKETVGGTQAQFDRIYGVRRKTGAGEQLASSTRLASIAAALLGVPCVRFYQDQLFFKGPGMQPSIYHQDSLAAPLDTNRLITLWLPLHNMTRAHGPLRFATGSHTDLNLLFWNEGVRKSEHPFFAYSMIEERFPIAQLGAVGPGDVSAHLGWTVHGAPPNRAATTRMAYAVSYFPDGTRSLPYTQLIAKYAVDDRLTWMGRINAADTPVEHHDFPIAFCRPDDQQDEAARPAAGGGGGGGGGGGQAGGDAATAVGSNRVLTLNLHERAGAEASEPAAMRAMFEPALHRPSGAVAGAPIPSKPKRASKDEV